VLTLSSLPARMEGKTHIQIESNQSSIHYGYRHYVEVLSSINGILNYNKSDNIGLSKAKTTQKSLLFHVFFLYFFLFSGSLMSCFDVNFN